MMDEGDTVAITYVPAHPESAELGYKWGKQLMGWVFLFFAAGGGAMVVYGLSLLVGLLTGQVKPESL